MAPFSDEYLFVEIANKVCNYFLIYTDTLTFYTLHFFQLFDVTRLQYLKDPPF